MDFLESISQHRIAPPAVTGNEKVADLIDQAFSSYNAAGCARSARSSRTSSLSLTAPSALRSRAR